MIYIEKGQLNKIALTLTESTTLSSPFYYIFEFIREYTTLPETQPGIYFTTPDVSPYTDRYNLFYLTEDNAGSTTGGNNIPLSLWSGQYRYNIYQSTTQSLDPDDFGTMIETGRMTVHGEDTQVDEIYR